MILSCLANGNSYRKRELTASSGLAVAARTRWFRGAEGSRNETVHLLLIELFTIILLLC